MHSRLLTDATFMATTPKSCCDAESYKNTESMPIVLVTVHTYNENSDAGRRKGKTTSDPEAAWRIRSSFRNINSNDPSECQSQTSLRVLK
jgi:hypothetical protein